MDVKLEPVYLEPKDDAAPGVDNGDGGQGAFKMDDFKPAVGGTARQAGSSGDAGALAIPPADHSKASAPGFTAQETSMNAVGTNEAGPRAGAPVGEGLGPGSKAGEEKEALGTTGEGVKHGWVAESNGLNGLGHEGPGLGSSAPGFASDTTTTLYAEAHTGGVGKVLGGKSTPEC